MLQDIIKELKTPQVERKCIPQSAVQEWMAGGPPFRRVANPSARTGGRPFYVTEVNAYLLRVPHSSVFEGCGF